MLSLAAGALLTVAAAGQSVAPALSVNSFPVGLKPLGMDMWFDGADATFVVANSGDNSISEIFMGLRSASQPVPVTAGLGTTVQGIPAPYAVAKCPDRYTALATSPSDNSVTVVHLDGKPLQTIKVGSQPYSVACFGATTGIVSNFGDNSLTVFNPLTGAVVNTIPGVPGSRSFHGIAVFWNSNYEIIAWVAGTDANALTMVNLSTLKVVVQVPVSRPTAVRISGTSPDAVVSVASAGDNSIRSYDANTAQFRSARDVPNPQDFDSGFVVIGGQDAIWVPAWRNNWTGQTSPSGLVPVPGAASIAAQSFATPKGPILGLLVTSTNSNSVYLIQQPPGYPADFYVSNAASFATAQSAPGALASVFLSTGVTQSFFATSVPLPTALGGVSLRVGGSFSLGATSGWTYSSTGSVQARLLYVGPKQVNFQIPPSIAPANPVPVQLTKADGTTVLANVNVTATGPGLFTVIPNGQGQAAVLNQDNSINGSPQAIVGAKPAARGSVIQIFATGAGETTPALAAGEAAPATGNPLVLTKVQPTVTVGGKSAKVLFSGMAPGFVGLWQINAEVPQDVTPSMAVPLVVTAAGVSSNTVTIAVQ
jgi:uncharacterized protein (TIGR03437 family)